MRERLRRRVVERQRRYGWRFAPVLVFGLWLGVLTVIQLGLGYWWGWASYTLLGTSAAWMVFLGVWLFFSRGPDPEAEVRALATESWGAVVAAVGATSAFVGLIFGIWLALPAFGLFVLGLAMLGRELAAQRRVP